jgi:hypothetical protein
LDRARALVLLVKNGSSKFAKALDTTTQISGFVGLELVAPAIRDLLQIRRHVCDDASPVHASIKTAVCFFIVVYNRGGRIRRADDGPRIADVNAP